MVTVLLFASGCGGDDGDSDDAQATTTTKATSTPTTISAVAEASEAAAMKLTDLGDPWNEHTPAAGVKKASTDNCMSKAGIYAGLADDARYQGAIFQRGDATRFVRSNTYTFETEDEAKAMTAHLATEEYANCEAEQMSTRLAADPRAAEGSSYRVEDIAQVPEGQGEDGYAGSVTYRLQEVVDGELQDVSALAEDVLYRNGRTVLFMFIETAANENDPPDLHVVVNDETVKAAAQAIARASR